MYYLANTVTSCIISRAMPTFRSFLGKQCCWHICTATVSKVPEISGCTGKWAVLSGNWCGRWNLPWLDQKLWAPCFMKWAWVIWSDCQACSQVELSLNHQTFFVSHLLVLQLLRQWKHMHMSLDCLGFTGEFITATACILTLPATAYQKLLYDSSLNGVTLFETV